MHTYPVGPARHSVHLSVGMAKSVVHTISPSVTHGTPADAQRSAHDLPTHASVARGSGSALEGLAPRAGQPQPHAMVDSSDSESRRSGLRNELRERPRVRSPPPLSGLPESEEAAGEGGGEQGASGDAARRERSATRARSKSRERSKSRGRRVAGGPPDALPQYQAAMPSQDEVRSARWQPDSYTLGLLNMGNVPSAKDYAMKRCVFLENIATMPCVITILLECRENHLRELKRLSQGTLLSGENEVAPDERPFGAPSCYEARDTRVSTSGLPDMRQGYNWIHSPEWDGDHGPVIFCRQSQVRKVTRIDTEIMQHGNKGRSRIMVCQINWHKNDLLENICVFHLNNEAAKQDKRRTAFFKRLAELSASRACRIMCGDANMAMWGMVQGLASHGIGCHCLAWHVEPGPTEP